MTSPGRPRTRTDIGHHLTPVDRHVAAVLDQRRKDLGISLNAMRAESGPLKVSLNQVAKYFAGHDRMSVGVLYAVCTRLGVSVDWPFLTLDEDPYPVIDIDERSVELLRTTDGMPSRKRKLVCRLAKELAE